MSDREDLSRLVALADQAKAHNFRPDTEAGRDALADLWAAVDSVRASGVQGELELGPQGHRYAWCPECGELRPEEVYEDGCCRRCKRTAVGPGIDSLVDRYNREVELSARRLAAARTMRDHARGVMRALGAVRFEMTYICPFCDAKHGSMADMVAHGETCEKHPAVVRLKGILKAASGPPKALMTYLSRGTKDDLASLVESMSALNIAVESMPEPGKDGGV